MNQINTSISPSSPVSKASPLSEKIKREVKSLADASAKKALERRGADFLPTQRKFVKREDSRSTPFPRVEPKEFTSDDAPYVITSEVGQLETLTQLKNMPPPEEGLYLGFSFEFNYHLLAERPVKFAWICDINKRMHILYDFIQKTIVKTSHRQAFMQLFMEEITRNHETYFLCQTGFEEKVSMHYLNNEFSWLYSDEKFLRIQQLYLDQKIAHVNLDVVEDAYFFGRLKDWASEQNLKFDVIYLSNIPEWLQRTSHHSLIKMKTNLLQILSPETLLIDAKQLHYESGAPVLRITRNITESKSFPPFNPIKHK